MDKIPLVKGGKLNSLGGFMKLLSTIFVLIFAQSALASGPMGFNVDSKGTGYGIEETVAEAIEVAMDYAMKRASVVTDEDLAVAEEGGWILVDGDWLGESDSAKFCGMDDLRKSQIECKILPEKNYKYRCDVEATFDCEIAAWHESQ